MSPLRPYQPVYVPLSQPIRCLVVDDEPLIRRLTSRQISRVCKDARVDVAASGTNAIRMCETAGKYPNCFETLTQSLDTPDMAS